MARTSVQFGPEFPNSQFPTFSPTQARYFSSDVMPSTGPNSPCLFPNPPNTPLSMNYSFPPPSLYQLPQFRFSPSGTGSSEIWSSWSPHQDNRVMQPYLSFPPAVGMDQQGYPNLFLNWRYGFENGTYDYQQATPPRHMEIGHWNQIPENRWNFARPGRTPEKSLRGVRRRRLESSSEFQLSCYSEDHLFEVAQDQEGSRLIQMRLGEMGMEKEREMVLSAMMRNPLFSMTHKYGNYVVQKLLGPKMLSSDLRQYLLDVVVSLSLTLSKDTYGCRVVQRALEKADWQERDQILMSLRGFVDVLMQDPNANHVIQKALEIGGEQPDKIQFVLDEMLTGSPEKAKHLAMHKFGCRVLQKMFLHCSEEQKKCAFAALVPSALDLALDQYGNYVVQHMMDQGGPQVRHGICQALLGRVMQTSQHKHASNVVEKCLELAEPRDREQIIEELLVAEPLKPDSDSTFHILMRDQFANYVVQKMLTVASGAQRKKLLAGIKPVVRDLQRFAFGRHIIAKLEMFFKDLGLENGVPAGGFYHH